MTLRVVTVMANGGQMLKHVAQKACTASVKELGTEPAFASKTVIHSPDSAAPVQGGLWLGYQLVCSSLDRAVNGAHGESLGTLVASAALMATEWSEICWPSGCGRTAWPSLAARTLAAMCWANTMHFD